MHRRVRTICALLVLCALLVSGCTSAKRTLEKAEEAVSGVAEGAATSAAATPAKGGKGEAEPTPLQEQEPSEEEPSEEEAIDPEEVTAFDRLNSYRMTQVMRWNVEDKDGTEEGEMLWEIAYVRQPPAMHWRMRGREGPDAEEESWMEMIWVDGATYMNFGEGWMAMTSQDEMENPWTHSPDDYISGDSQRVGTETVNGYRCVHYRARDTEALLGIGQVTEADYWVSTEHDVVVRSIVKWAATDGEGRSGQYDLQWDITEINEPISIVAPEGVAKPGLPEDVPLMAGATNLSSMMGITTFDIDATAEEVTTFYMEALADNGWTHEDSAIATMHSFSKDGRSLTLMIDDEETPTSVTIMISEE